MAIQLEWIPYGGTNSVSQDIDRNDLGIIATVGADESTYVDPSPNPNTVYSYTVLNNCFVGGPVSSDPTVGISWECPVISVTNIESGFSVSADPLEFGYYYSIDLYDQDNITLVTNGDPFAPTKERVNQSFIGLDSGVSYTVRVVIIPQDPQGEPDMSGLYSYDCTEQGTVSAPVVCNDCTGQALTSEVLDTPASSSYSKGFVQIGYNNGTAYSTGGVAKATGSLTQSPAGNTGGGTDCDTGYVYIEAHEPTISLPNPEFYYTQVKVYLNGSLLATLDGNPGLSGINGGVTSQTFTYTRSTNDIIHVQWNSIPV